MWGLKLRMWLLVTVLFGIVYAIIVVIGRTFLHVGDFSFYLIISLVLMFIQYMLGPKIVEWSMRVKYIKREENPRLFQIVESLANRANIPVPKIGIAQIEIPNAFAFGRGRGDGRVCVTRGILNLLSDEELKAVLGHELTHLKNRDVLTITLLSVIPMIMYRIAWEFLFSLQMRIVLASILTALIAELIDTKVYQLWTMGGREKWPQWTRVFASNSVSIPVDSLLFPIIAFAGVVGAEGLQQMVWTNIIVKGLVTALVFWTIYLVPEKPIYGD